MTLLEEPTAAVTTEVTRPQRPKKRLGGSRSSWLTTTDHKMIGYLYLITSFVFFLVGGLMALVMRAELARPGMQFVSNEQYNQLFTMHGTIMLLLFATPLFVGFANVIMPLQIGSPDVAFPRLNMLSYWMFLFGGIIVMPGFLTPGGAASFGWFALRAAVGVAPTALASGPTCGSWASRSPVWAPSSVRSTSSPRSSACARPGMTMFRMPIFTWNILLTSVLVLMAFPVLAAALLVLEIDRQFGSQVFDASSGGAMLWQHLFWFFGHPEVYIIALPFFGIVTEIIPVFSRKPIFGYKGLVFATLAIAALSVAVWAHHMFVTGAVLLPFFAFMTMLIAVPTGVKFFNWIGTMWRGSVSFETADAVGDRLPRDLPVRRPHRHDPGLAAARLPVSDSYFVVAHFHYVVFGTVVFAMFGGFYFWWPKFTGRMLDERLGKVHFWLLFIGFHMTFLVQHWLGVDRDAAPLRRLPAGDGFTMLNSLSTIGAFVLGVSTLPFL